MILYKVLTLCIGTSLIGVSYYLSKKERFIKRNIDREADKDIESSIDINIERDDIVLEKTESLQLEQEKIENNITSFVNRKMLEFNEFANQVLEKIGIAHKEVIFLYDMLSEKEKELRVIFESVDKYNEKKDIIEFTEQEEIKIEDIYKNQAFNIQNELVDISVNENSDSEEGCNNTSIQTSSEEKIEPMKENRSSITDLYEDIMKLSKQGKEAIEISKELKLGIGEVNLVLNLYNHGK